MSDLISSIAVIVVMTMLLAIAQGRFERWERPWLWGSLILHFVAAVGQVLMVVKFYGSGDLLAYQRTGILLARFLEEYPVEGTYRLIQVFFWQSEVALPVRIFLGATGAMQAVSGFIMLLVNDSLYAACILLGGLSFFSAICIYRVFKRELGQEFHRAALLGCLWVPSVAFWSSALLKESVAMVGFGLLLYGGHSLATRRRPLLGLLLFCVGSTVVAPLKPYLLLPFGLAAGVWLYLDGPRPAHRRRLRKIRPGPFVLGVVFAVTFVLGIGKLFPEFDVSGLAEEAASMQAGIEKTRGGSNYSMGNPDDRSFAGQLSFAPLAIVTALFRPTLLDIHNPLSALNAIETTGVTLLLLVALVRSGPAGFARAVFGSPIFGFCAVYVLVLALGVGLGTTNLGTLSRYRMPLMPFFVTTLLVLARRQRRSVGIRVFAAVRAPMHTERLDA